MLNCPAFLFQQAFGGNQFFICLDNAVIISELPLKSHGRDY